MKKFLWILLGLIVLPVLAASVYWFSGWQALPSEVPQQQQLHQPQLTAAAAASMQALVDARAEQSLPALTAAVVWQGELVWGGAAGFADVEKQQPVTTNSQFRIGSSSKPVTATAIARAVQAGTLQLDTPISQYQADLPNPAWGDFTLRQLLSHTAGLPGYEQNSDWVGVWRTLVKQHRYTDVMDSLALFDQAQLQYQPGSGFLYSSFGINLASAVLQSAVDEPFLAYLSREISQPLALPSLMAAEVAYQAQVQFYFSNEQQVKPHWPVDLSQKWAGGGLAASSVDLAKLGAAWLDPAFISADIQQQFWTPQKLTNGEVNDQNYALGWRVTERDFLFCDQDHKLTKAIRYIHHGGVSDGAQSWLVVYPELQLVLAMNTNTVKENYCDFAGQAAAIIRPFLRHIAPELLAEAE
ncbi:serine hydrolase domain-containing protein [Rheinheimera riviphila]|nr:serine hydrolase domain-containing protein [Rheinheimera riviphila]